MSVRGSTNVVRIGSTGNSDFEDYTTTNAYVERTFGFLAQRITVTNDSTASDDVSVSYDGATLEGVLKGGETKDFFPSGRSSVYIKADTGGEKARIWAE